MSLLKNKTYLKKIEKGVIENAIFWYLYYN